MAPKTMENCHFELAKQSINTVASRATLKSPEGNGLMFHKIHECLGDVLKHGEADDVPIYRCLSNKYVFSN